MYVCKQSMCVMMMPVIFDVMLTIQSDVTLHLAQDYSPTKLR